MTFGLCYQCGRMHCSTCRKKMMMAQMQKVQLNEPRMFGATCPWCRSPMESATPRYLLLRELLERRPRGRHVKHCLFESRAVWKSNVAWDVHAIEQTQLRRNIASMAWGARNLISTQVRGDARDRSRVQ